MTVILGPQSPCSHGETVTGTLIKKPLMPAAGGLSKRGTWCSETTNSRNPAIGELRRWGVSQTLAIGHQQMEEGTRQEENIPGSVNSTGKALR